MIVLLWKARDDMWLCEYELSKECNRKYRNCTDYILDKIKAEIIQIIRVRIKENGPQHVIGSRITPKIKEVVPSSTAFFCS